MINYSLSYRNTTITNSDGTKTKKALCYAKAQDSGQMSLADFTELATEKSVYGSGVLQAVITVLAKKIIDYAKNSYRITVGDIGTFSAGLTSKGVDDIADFSPSSHITKSYIKLTKNSKGEVNFACLKGVSYKLVPTTANQAANNRATKNAATSVSLGDSSAKTRARTYLAGQNSNS